MKSKPTATKSRIVGSVFLKELSSLTIKFKIPRKNNLWLYASEIKPFETSKKRQNRANHSC